MVSASSNTKPMPNSAEFSMGLRLFYTDTPGAGGKLRRRAEDFVVEELSYHPPPVKEGGRGRFTVAKVRAFNWETNRLVKRFVRELGLRNNQVHFAGTKDKRGITTQLITFETEAEKLKSIRIPDVTITDIYSSNVHLKLGRLFGNKFNILLSNTDLKSDNLKDTVITTKEQLDKLNGFPNFFGVQRFGAIRPITHEVGRFIVKRKFEEAVWTYIANPLEFDPVGNEARKNLAKTKDLKTALEEYPKELEFERIIIRYLIDNPDDWTGALRRFPQNLLSMFVHSYQSYIFNLILCERINKGVSLIEPQLGDLILPVDKDGLPIHTEWHTVNASNQSKLKRLISRHSAYISGILFGSETKFAEGIQGEIERKFIDDEKLVPDDFVIPELLKNPLRGIRRELVAPVSDLELEFQKDSVRFQFKLNKGTYATSYLREFMKADAANY